VKGKFHKPRMRKKGKGGSPEVFTPGYSVKNRDPPPKGKIVLWSTRNNLKLWGKRKETSPSYCHRKSLGEHFFTSNNQKRGIPVA